MSTYRIHCRPTYIGFYDVEANNEEEAKTKAQELLWGDEEMDGKIETDGEIIDILKLY